MTKSLCSTEQESFEGKVFRVFRGNATVGRGIGGSHQVSVPCLLPDFGVVEVEVDDDEGERRDALASFGFKQSPEVTVLEDEWREFLIGRRGCEFAHKFDALFVQLSAQWKDRPLLQLGNIIQLTLPFIREHLLEGQLVKERILDGAAVELALQGSPGQTQRHRQ